MSIGIFVEDRRSGKEAIRELVRKILGARNVRIHMRVPPRGDMLSAAKMRVYVDVLFKQHSDVSKIIVCLDSECTDPGKIRSRVGRIQQELANMAEAPSPQYVVVVHALEGWLAADPDAVGQVVQSNISARIPQNLEAVCKPADLLSDIFEKCGKDFSKSRHNPKIAEYAEPKEISRRNASFRQFQDAIVDP